ncbi:hypothetical protein SAMN04489727_6358 [Amycolatopsis tolypomycina]|uniref:Serine aminopeptidase S33 domain-containing protein n=1 Tax=Amycolatopsis tolypomycina TaxID=208445 RepID=A0A1H4XTR6_9PSEU|nr:alpha/beta hydrolase [Amycolatopsis tolypomycina]SED08915.1 hypothetical protein SAMN04489727_6358 [Amycolatopsis tolypomycina]
MDAEAVARTVVEMLLGERFEEVVRRFSRPLRKAVPADALRSAWAAVAPTAVTGPAVTEPGQAGLTRVHLPVGGCTVVMSVDDRGVVHGLRFAPASDPLWTAPSYADPRVFAEREITLGGTTGATVTSPVTAGGAGVVLLAGGGPFDRDESSGPNKPLKDLAWGLATRGVTVVRFDKTPAPTMTEEYLPPALAALAVLRGEPGVERVFVAGHSMGGKVAPRVAEADPAVAGLVILAGDAQPMHHAAVRVARHLGLDPATFEQQAALVDSDRLTPETPSAELPFGLPASYWLDLRGYDPVAATAGLPQPVFLGQGGRDYQVTVADDLTRWRTGLAGRPGVTIEVYERLDHLFLPGDGPSAPADYTRPGHVDAAVVSDVAGWLARVG